MTMLKTDITPFYIFIKDWVSKTLEYLFNITFPSII